MKVQLLKGETKETFGEGDNSFDYYFRPLTVEEKNTVNSHVVWKEGKKHNSIDFSKFDAAELVRLAVTRIDRLYDSDEQKIDTIEKLFELKADAGYIDGIITTMWVKIWISMSLSEEVKKKLLPDSTPAATA